MRVQDEDTWESEYWDEYIQEFGLAAYVEARYMAPIRIANTAGPVVCKLDYTSDDLDRIVVERDRLRSKERTSEGEAYR